MMKKEWQSGGLCLLILGGLLAGCLSGCRSTEPLPNKVTTTSVHTVSTTATAPVDTMTKAPFKTEPDPTGYVDLVDSEDWPCREFNSVEGFIHWIENPNFKMEKSPLEPEKDEHGYDVYKRSYFDALYPDYQQMFAVDRFYMLPDVPSDWELTDIQIRSHNTDFYYLDNQKNEYYLSYNYSESSHNLNSVESSEFFAFKKILNDQEYYVIDFDLQAVAQKKGSFIFTLVNGYLCEFAMQTYNPDEKDSATEGSERVVYSENTDLTDVVSKMKFKRIDLPPLKQ